ncbi:hypothetical protein FOMG_09952 [Fusarium oxysporum f. sp. melonis 26406]|uniref:Azaphilone pigments biosynthesis cluster protein L N-terminal domain-containing protein n=1 Tax=Fusarium oxysporum f. sp. melonis 26406 TaxID=1089452 RepID=X0A1Y1_FUSOX|nr:hypothetical protein FOMG_09952 [Fusarium oxysporum f. sp. melonis 26406]KAJ9418019.1 hypothetical protein QL093DRAFT_2639917 [Fusarium oxysporum]
MAEAVGIAAAVMQLTQLAVQVLATGYAFLAKLSKAPSEVRQLLTEVAALDYILGRLQALASTTPAEAAADNMVLALQQAGVLTDCKDMLQHAPSGPNAYCILPPLGYSWCTGGAVSCVTSGSNC